MSSDRLSHVDSEGNARMVDVSEKNVTRRQATARARVLLPPAVLDAVRDGDVHTAKGPVFQTARIAGVGGAKQTASLIPFCHPLALEKCQIDIQVQGDHVVIDCTVVIHGRTGVEMEALTGASVAALTIYDMCKAIDREMSVERLRLESKQGGKSGDYQRA